MSRPSIAAFPENDHLYVVWAYGSFQLSGSKSTAPQIEVALRRLDSPFDLNDIEPVHVIKIVVAQLDIVRLGTIWRRRQRLESVFTQYGFNNQSDQPSYSQRELFHFNFDMSEMESVNLFDRDPSTEQSYISSRYYPLGTMSNAEKTRFLKSTYTKLTDNEEFPVTVLIPSAELLTSCFTPKEMQIRNKLITYKLDDLLKEYLNIEFSAENDGGKYEVFLNYPKEPTNTRFLAYAQCNSTTSYRLRKMMSSFQIANSDPTGSLYPDRYPVIFPYHPDELTIEADGLWLSDYTFLVLRINKFSQPGCHEIITYLERQKMKSQDGGSNNGGGQRGSPGPYDTTEDYDILDDTDPHSNAGKKYVTSEVEVIGDPKPIDEVTDYKEVERKKQKKRNLQEPRENSQASSGETNSSKNSEGVSQLKQSETDAKNAESILKEVQQALVNLKNTKQIHSLEFLSATGVKLEKGSFTVFPKEFENHEESHNWALFQSEGLNKVYRGLLIAKVGLNGSGKKVYLLEIQRKTKNEKFTGLLFDFVPEPNELAFSKLLEAVVSNRGVFRNRVGGELVKKHLSDVLSKTEILFHSKGSQTWEVKILSVLNSF